MIKNIYLMLTRLRTQVYLPFVLKYSVLSMN
jgi:hypothetical protein